LDVVVSLVAVTNLECIDKVFSFCRMGHKDPSFFLDNFFFKKWNVPSPLLFLLAAAGQDINNAGQTFLSFHQFQR